MRSIVSHSFAKNRYNQFRVDIFCIEVFVLGVKEEGGGVRANEVGESLAQHGEAENITILQRKDYSIKVFDGCNLINATS